MTTMKGIVSGWKLLGLEDRLAGLLVEAGLHGAGEGLAAVERVLHAGVVAVDVADAHLGHLAVALLHLGDDPFQGDDGLLRVGDHGGEEVRDAVVDGELEHLRVDHDQPALGGRELVEEAQDHGVDGDRLARAGGAGDEEVRHAGEVGDDGLAADVLAEREGQGVGAVAEALGGEDFAQEDVLAHLVGELDADDRAAGDGGAAAGQGGHRAGDVVGEADDAGGLEAGGGFELVHGDDGAGADRDDLAADAVVVEHGLEHAGVLLQRVAGEVVADDGGGALQERQRRGAPGVGGVGVELELRLLLGAGAGALRQRAGAGGLDARLGRGVGEEGVVAVEDGDVAAAERRDRAGGGGAGVGLGAGADGVLDLGHDAVLGRRPEERGVEAWGGAGCGGGLGLGGAAGAGVDGEVAGGAGAVGGAGHRPAGQAVGAGVEDDRALAEEAQEAAELGPGDAEGVGGADDEGRGERDGATMRREAATSKGRIERIAPRAASPRRPPRP